MHKANYEMTVAQWLEKNNLPNVPGTERFFLGQAITPEDAASLRRMLVRAYLDAAGMEIFAETVEFQYPHNVTFLGLFLKLVTDGVADYRGDQWRAQLCNTLTPDDRHAMLIMLGENCGQTQSKKRNRREHK